MTITLILAASYLLGSIPFGYIIGKIYKKDITKEGSRNIGATNTFRLLGPIPGAAALVLDLLKGTVSIILALRLYPEPLIVIAAGACAILGHSYSVFLKFNGGKGVAVGLGALLGIAPDVFIIAALWAVLIILTTRYVSLASITGSIFAAILMFISGKPLPYSLFVAAAAVLIIYKHKPNIQRLLNGTENKIARLGVKNAK